ncbi:cation:proton antiporter [Streptomyces capillispiralis]|uniref:Sodium/proton antiporter (CPA1 family) n=1 Tax=Streptomyces capillispiralis TaxID=68182 RepID=A0A561T870_9ACTN|nr:cation:proton antiporter [Streptomyces capillispiralis]TWF83305.1 sodium/proton antiporter (CPA1 family) [Streptomyces capillispiralis]GHH94230.1 cation transporter [Streptomyces capillispiralis]
MSSPDFLFTLLGAGALGAAVLPRVVARRPLSLPLVFLVCGVGLQLSRVPLPGIDPVSDRVWVEHVTEICVLVSLMGAGLALNRPFGRRGWRGTWRQLGITMPLTIAAVGALAWGVLGWPVAAALLLAAVLAPTDPVLASEVRVGAPTDSEHDEDEVRFTLTSEAGLNDGLAFPFVLAAVALAAAGGRVTGGGVAHWALVEVAYKCAVGVCAGLAVGALLGWLFFRAGWRTMRLSEHREGFVAIGATFLAYGVTELAHGYGFLAVFVTACRIRAAERAHGFHTVLHDFVEQVERLLTAALLFLLGVFVAQGGLAALTWLDALVGLLLLWVVRPLAAWAAQLGTPAGPRERLVIAFFGIRGIGSLFYLAHALGHSGFGVAAERLWAVVTFTVLASVVLHGVSATPVISRLDRLRRRRARAGGAGPEPDEDEVAGKRL